MSSSINATFMSSSIISNSTLSSSITSNLIMPSASTLSSSITSASMSSTSSTVNSTSSTVNSASSTVNSTSSTVNSTSSISPQTYHDYWVKVKQNWKTIYLAFTRGSQTDVEQANNLLNFLLGDELSKHLEIETTVGEINRITFDNCANLIEIYISPRLNISNVPHMEKLYDAAIDLTNTQINKYRAYNTKDTLIKDISYDDYTISYDDVGCQTNMSYNEKNNLVINLVLYVKKTAADRILEKKKISVIMPDGSTSEIEKWLPNKSTAIDILLLNVIGEYNFIHYIGYIEFIPEGDPLIAEGSIFTELKDIKTQLDIIYKASGTKTCKTCNRHKLQRSLLICTRCRDVLYCCKFCQSIDYKTHKLFCKKDE
jgi:hypothetical protein